MRSHERRSGTFTQDIWIEENGKRKQKLVRDKPNEDKVTLKRVFMNGMKLELFYYKEKPDDLFLGVGDKLSLLQDHEVKELRSLITIASNKMHLTGTWTKKKMNEEYKRLMKEKRQEEKYCELKSRDILMGKPETDPFRLRMREILSKK